MMTHNDIKLVKHTDFLVFPVKYYCNLHVCNLLRQKYICWCYFCSLLYLCNGQVYYCLLRYILNQEILILC